MKSRIILILIAFALVFSVGAVKTSKSIKPKVAKAQQTSKAEPIGGLAAEDR